MSIDEICACVNSSRKCIFESVPVDFISFFLKNSQKINIFGFFNSMRYDSMDNFQTKISESLGSPRPIKMNFLFCPENFLINAHYRRG